MTKQYDTIDFRIQSENDVKGHHRSGDRAVIITKYAVYAFVVITIIDLVVLYCSSGSEFRTLGYKINSYAFRVFDHLIPIWIGYAIYKIINSDKKVTFFSSIISYFAVIGLTFLFIIKLLLALFGSYGDGSYYRCMEECVNEDQSNYNECSLSTCDFPI